MRRVATGDEASERANDRRLGAGLVTAAAALWGLWPVFVRLGPGGARTAAIGLGVAGLASLPLALRQSARRATRPRGAWLALALLGITDAGNALCYFRALAEGAVAPAVLSHYLAPVFVALAAPALLGEPRTRRTPLALALAVAGTAALVLLGRGHGIIGGDARLARALALGSASAVFYAANVLLSKRLGRHFSDGEMMSYHSLVSGALLLPLVGVPSAAILYLWPTVGGLVSALGAGLLYYGGLRRLPAEQAGVLTYLEPVAAMLVGWLALGEPPSWAALVGGALILVGGMLVVTAPPPTAPPPTPISP